MRQIFYAHRVDSLLAPRGWIRERIYFLGLGFATLLEALTLIVSLGFYGSMFVDTYMLDEEEKRNNNGSRARR